MRQPYEDLFSCWADVMKEFSRAPEEEHREPDEVLYARYSYESYEGDADVIYRRGNKFYWQTGGHCSCYGLEENDWEPVEYDAPVLLAALEKHYKKEQFAHVIEALRAYA